MQSIEAVLYFTFSLLQITSLWKVVFFSLINHLSILSIRYRHVVPIDRTSQYGRHTVGSYQQYSCAVMSENNTNGIHPADIPNGYTVLYLIMCEEWLSMYIQIYTQYLYTYLCIVWYLLFNPVFLTNAVRIASI